MVCPTCGAPIEERDLISGFMRRVEKGKVLQKLNGFCDGCRSEISAYRYIIYCECHKIEAKKLEEEEELE